MKLKIEDIKRNKPKQPKFKENQLVDQRDTNKIHQIKE